MKKTKILYILSLALLLASCGGGGTSGSESSSATPHYDPQGYSEVIEKRIPLYGWTKNAAGSPVPVNQGTRLMYTVDGSSVPYVDLATFIEECVPYGRKSEGQWADYEVTALETNPNVAVVVNPANDSTLYIDFETREASYTDFETFFSMPKDVVSPHFNGAIFGSSILCDDKTIFEFSPGTDFYTIHLDDYNFAGYVYRGRYLLPFNLACALLNVNSSVADYLSYYIYDNNAMYLFPGDNFGDALTLNQILRAKGTDWMDEAYLDYNYNSLALYLDNFYGLDERQSRVEDGKIIKYMENGAHALLAPYKERLMSKEADVSNDALIEIFRDKLDDGGHDMYVSTNLFGTKNVTRLDPQVSGPETMHTLNTILGVAGARKEKGTDAASVLGVSDPNGYYKEYNDGTTAYVQFDGFTYLKTDVFDPSTVTDDNYYANSVSLFYYVNQKIQNNPNIKDVIIDLSGNGGGTLYTCEFIASWISGGTTGTVRNTKTGSFMKYTIQADVNFDGHFNEKDYIAKNINVYLMISNGSFSSANKLTCDVYDNRKENTYFVGARTGGGSCGVGNFSFNCLGGMPRISSALQLGTIDATASNFVSVEKGVYPTSGWEIDNADYAKFADVDAIAKKVLDQRAN